MSPLVRVLIEMVQPRRMKCAGAPDQSVHCVAFSQEQLGKVRTILACDSCDQCNLGHLSSPSLMFSRVQ